MPTFVEILSRPEFIISALVLVVGAMAALAFADRGQPSSELGPPPTSYIPPDRHMFTSAPQHAPPTPDPRIADAAPLDYGPPRPHAAPAQHRRRSTALAPAAPVGPDAQPAIQAERPKTTFADVAGVDEAVQELQEIKEYLTDPEPFRVVGARLPKGILLYGPPGVGKTLLARALAGESRSAFYSVSGSSFVQLYVGVGPARVRELFAEAKKNEPAIVFIDELDAVGRRRGGGMPTINEERESTLNQLLVEMDGFDAGSGVIVVGATNRVDVLDPALLRSGRFDRRIEVDLPDVRGRAEIIRVHTRDKPLANDVDIDRVARQTVGLSGADLGNVVNEGALLAARERSSEVATAHFTEAIERVLAGPARRNRVMSPADRKRIAFHEAGHAVAAAGLPYADPVRKVSIVARGKGGGFTWFAPAIDRVLVTRSEMLDRLAAILAGKVCEETMLGEPSSGANDDLGRATELARNMITKLGMHPMVNVTTWGPGETTAPSERLAARIDSEVEALLVEAQDRAGVILRENVHVLEDLVAELDRVESIEGDDLDRFLRRVSRLEPNDQMRLERPRGGSGNGALTPTWFSRGEPGF